MAGQSDSTLSLFSADEVEFMAEDELVEIVPNMRMDKLTLISGDYGPFFPQMPAHVPLWLAIALKKRGKCTIRLPDWMSVENLSQTLEAERDSQESFQVLPFHYVEISRLLFDHARGDIPDVYTVKNLSAMEVNLVRPFVGRALQAFYKHGSPDLVPNPERMPPRRPQATDNIQRKMLIIVRQKGTEDLIHMNEMIAHQPGKHFPLFFCPALNGISSFQ